MLRLVFVIIISIPFIIYYEILALRIEAHPEKYGEKERYKLARKVVRRLKINGFIGTKVYGTENLPKEGGYVMCSNHQGKYDAVGIMYGHKEPCTILMDAKRSKLAIADQFMRLIRGCRMDKTSIKSQVKAINDIANEVKNGRKYIIFPEGGYYHNKNIVREFMPGAFKCAIRAKSPIVPVAIIDSYKPFEGFSITPVVTQVHYLPPIMYEDYCHMNTEQISNHVRELIVEKIDSILSKRKKA